MKLEFGLGTTVQTVEVPDENVIGVLHANEVAHELMGEEEVRRALSHWRASFEGCGKTR